MPRLALVSACGVACAVAVAMAAGGDEKLPPLAEVASSSEMKQVEAEPFYWIVLDTPDITLFIFSEVEKSETRLRGRTAWQPTDLRSTRGGIQPIGDARLELANGLKVVVEGDTLDIGGRIFSNTRPDPGFSVVIHRDGSLEKYPGHSAPG